MQRQSANPKCGHQGPCTGEPKHPTAVIDRTVLWFGSIELTGSRHREDDNVMRIHAPAIASEMLGYILGSGEN